MYIILPHHNETEILLVYIVSIKKLVHDEKGNGSQTLTDVLISPTDFSSRYAYIISEHSLDKEKY